MNLDTEVGKLSGVGPSYVKKLNKIKIKSVKDLFYHFPRRYDDFSKVTPIKLLRAGENTSIKGVVWQSGNKRSKRGVFVTEIVLADESGTIKAVWFNQPFLKNTIKSGDEIILAGKPEWNLGSLQFNSPSYEKVANQKSPILPKNMEGLDHSAGEYRHTAGIIPVYPETEGLSSKWLRYKIKPLLKFVDDIKEYLPEELRKKYNLLNINDSLKELHFPGNNAILEKAKRRVDFEEMFLLQLAVLSAKKELQKEKAAEISFDKEYAKKFVAKLGFNLTNSQRKAAFEILKDMEKAVPMNRLLEGDVGSGKTLVAAMALSMAAHKGFQAVIIAPTEILAKQHYETLFKLLPEFKLLLLTGSSAESVDIKKQKKNISKQKNDCLQLISIGEANIIIGTHSLLQEKIKFHNLGLVVIDEQHRFGVEQRAYLRKENNNGLTPHFLSMSATPIPRTLTLTIYGDLDVSILDEMPPGRKPITTRLIENSKRVGAYKFLEDQIDEGRQIFVVCPLIEESDKLGVKSVEKEFEKLDKVIFPHKKIAMLHGKMKSSEKEKIMRDFEKGEIDILVSTSVIEVGVNIPNATIMMIEGAERFGLAQLHQFRGRVGRGKHKSYCFLFSDSRNDITLKRLYSFVSLQDGFKLAEIDLETRGPGEVFGKSQHGLPDIKTRNLLNITLVKETRKAAIEFLKENDLENITLLKEKVKGYDIITKLD